MYAVTNTRVKIENMQYNLYLKTDFLGCFETLEEAQEAVAKFTEKIKGKVKDVRLCSSGECEFYVTEIRQCSEHVNNLQIHVIN
ncbi:hypothetical protein [uncultured Ligilactobacillus sp.]|uniref:hypothetical protein n=1 Tax=uncultured Ligilactobacillus sp. TaxID=2837633 RepID=UPI00272CC1BE|nr:hypothetical protein [uncultured Ligilactobacillus sp.]